MKASADDRFEVGAATGSSQHVSQVTAEQAASEINSGRGDT
jgi:hypothetical protein